MWTDLSLEWKTAFEEAWIAFKNGSTPIGAALFDKDGTLVLKNHNRANEKGTVNKRTSHAEANILHDLDTGKYNFCELVLYSTMEPCPMCMGTSVMAGIRKLRFAARDPYCGFVHLKDTEPYFISKNLDFTFADNEMELVQLTVQSYYELYNIGQGSSDKVFMQFQKHCPKAAENAKTLFAKKLLDCYAKEEKPFSEIYDYILSL